MRIVKIKISDPDPKIIENAARTVLKGGAVVLPTDTAYGLVVNAQDKKAVERLVKIKGRPGGKPLPIAIRDIRAARKLAFFNRAALNLVQKFWPGPLTLVLKKKKVLPPLVTGGQKDIGLRIPDSKVCQALAGRLGFPYTITSANLSGEETPYSAKEVVKQFFSEKIKPDLILDGGKLKKNKTSTVVQVSSGKVKIIREGPVGLSEILGALKEK